MTTSLFSSLDVTNLQPLYVSSTTNHGPVQQTAYMPVDQTTFREGCNGYSVYLSRENKRHERSKDGLCCRWVLGQRYEQSLVAALLFQRRILYFDSCCRSLVFG